MPCRQAKEQGACSVPPSVRAPRTFGAPSARGAFTLLEVLVALALLVTAFTIVWSTFSSTVRAWRRGAQLADELQRGDFVLDQLALAMRSAVYFRTHDDVYGLRLENAEREYPADQFSWVTSSTAFIPPDSPLVRSIHRLEVAIEDDAEGRPSVAVRAWPYLVDPEEEGLDIETWYFTTGVKGLDCRIYNAEDEDWDDEWENTNRVPTRVELSVYLDPLKEGGDPVVLSRAIEIPVAAATNVPPTRTAGGGA